MGFSPRDYLFVAIAIVLGGWGLWLVLARYHLLGPLCAFELVRSTRKGFHVRLRVAFALALLATLLIVYLDWFPDLDPLAVVLGQAPMLPLDARAQFGESFVYAFLMVQMIAVMMITPALTAGSIIDEKKRRTMETLFAVGLSDHEIILGKLVARLIQVAGVLFTGLPILALSLFFGGIDGAILLAAYAGTVVTMLSMGALSMAWAVRSRTLGQALFGVYMTLIAAFVALALLGCATALIPAAIPFFFLQWLFDPPASLQPTSVGLLLGANATLNGILAFVASRYAINHLRESSLTSEEKPEPRYSREPARPQWITPVAGYFRDEVGDEIPIDDVVPLTEVVYRPSAPPLGDENPLLWKERWFGQGRRTTISDVMETIYPAGQILLITLGMGLLTVGLLVFILESAPSVVFGRLVTFLGGLILLTMLIRAGGEASGSITREREQRTLDGLRALPINRSQILRAKWRSSWWRVRLASWLFLSILIVVGLFAGGLHWASVLVSLVFATVMLAFAITLGEWLSVRCRSTTTATVCWWLIILGIMVGPWLLAALLGSVARLGGIDLMISTEVSGTDLIRATSPITGWQWSTLVGVEEAPRSALTAENRLALALIATIFWLLVTILLWWWTCRRFERADPT